MRYHFCKIYRLNCLSQNIIQMDTKHLIFEVTEFLELQRLLDQHAQSGYKTVSFCSYYDYGQGQTYYNALMVKEGDSGN